LLAGVSERPESALLVKRSFLGYGFGAGLVLIKWSEQIADEAMTALWALEALKWTTKFSRYDYDVTTPH
jgi:hypothetical protein